MIVLWHAKDLTARRERISGRLDILVVPETIRVIHAASFHGEKHSTFVSGVVKLFTTADMAAKEAREASVGLALSTERLSVSKSGRTMATNLPWPACPGWRVSFFSKLLSHDIAAIAVMG